MFTVTYAQTNGNGPQVIERHIIAAHELGRWLLDGWQLDGASWWRDMSHCTVYRWRKVEAQS